MPNLFKKVSWSKVKESFSGVDSQTTKLCKSAAEGKGNEFTKLLGDYRFLGTRDANTVRVVAAILIMGSKDIPDIEKPKPEDIKKVFKLLGQGKGDGARAELEKIGLDKFVFQGIEEGKRDKKWNEFLAQVGKIKTWKKSAGSIKKNVLPYLRENMPLAGTAFERGLAKFITGKNKVSDTNYTQLDKKTYQKRMKYGISDESIEDFWYHLRKRLGTAFGDEEKNIAALRFDRFNFDEDPKAKKKWADDVARIIRVYRIAQNTILPASFELVEFEDACKNAQQPNEWLKYLVTSALQCVPIQHGLELIAEIEKEVPELKAKIEQIKNGTKRENKSTAKGEEDLRYLEKCLNDKVDYRELEMVGDRYNHFYLNEQNPKEKWANDAIQIIKVYRMIKKVGVIPQDYFNTRYFYEACQHTSDKDAWLRYIVRCAVNPNLAEVNGGFSIMNLPANIEKEIPALKAKIEQIKNEELSKIEPLAEVNKQVSTEKPKPNIKVTRAEILSAPIPAPKIEKAQIVSSPIYKAGKVLSASDSKRLKPPMSPPKLETAMEGIISKQPPPERPKPNHNKTVKKAWEPAPPKVKAKKYKTRVAKDDQIKNFEKVSNAFDGATKGMKEMNDQIAADKTWGAVLASKDSDLNIRVNRLKRTAGYEKIEDSNSSQKSYEKLRLMENQLVKYGRSDRKPSLMFFEKLKPIYEANGFEFGEAAQGFLRLHQK